jgi:parallel beta-helix repeat protein
MTKSLLKFLLKNLLIIAIFAFLGINSWFLNTANAEEIFIPLQSSFPGIIEGEGIHFEITDSAYLNITLDSSEVIKLRLESIPEMVTITIERPSSTSASQTQITISGFKSLTTYYKFQDDYHKLTAFTTDENGQYSYFQDLSKSHFVFIQPRVSTKFIKDNATGGDCTLIGVWDWPAKTCTLTTDLNESIQIDNDGIALDGNGRTTTGTNTGMGVYLYQRTNIIIKNLEISAFSEGFRAYRSSNTTFLNNSVLNNTGSGINLYYSNDSVVKNNNVSNNGGGAFLYFSSGGNSFVNNSISNNNGDGINLLFSSSNNLTQNTISNHGFDGISLSSSSNNNIKDNIIDASKYDGISLGRESHNNTIDSNTVSSTILNFGIYLRESNNNVVKNNTSKFNNYAGIYVLYADNNNFAAVYPGSIGNLFNLSLPVGGNYWSNFDTPAEGCSDANNDNFCDAPYVFSGGQDNYPWTKQDGWKIPVVEKMIKPVEGYLHSAHGWRKDPFTGELALHDGIDIIGLVPQEIYEEIYGREIVAPANGKIIDTGYDQCIEEWMKIYHGDVIRQDDTTGSDVSTRYYHLKTTYKEIEELVLKGEAIAEVGGKYCEGWSGAPHLHLSVYEDVKSINPLKYVEYFPRPGKGIRITSHSPVDIIITDPEGLTISKQSIEIPETVTYLEEDFNGDGILDDQIWITDRKIGGYLITVIPEPDALPTDMYNLEVLGDGMTIVLAEDMPISEIPDERYGIRSTETAIEKMIPTKVVYTGDTSGYYSDHR